MAPGGNELHLRLKEIGTGVDQFWRWQLAKLAIDGRDLALQRLQTIARGRFESGENRSLSLGQCFVDVLLNGSSADSAGRDSRKLPQRVSASR